MEYHDTITVRESYERSKKRYEKAIAELKEIGPTYAAMAERFGDDDTSKEVMDVIAIILGECHIITSHHASIIVHVQQLLNGMSFPYDALVNHFSQIKFDFKDQYVGDKVIEAFGEPYGSRGDTLNRRGNIINAIKAYRELTGADLHLANYRAKEIVSEYLKDFDMKYGTRT